jgi:hypothetical protein
LCHALLTPRSALQKRLWDLVVLPNKILHEKKEYPITGAGTARESPQTVPVTLDVMDWNE